CFKYVAAAHERHPEPPNGPQAVFWTHLVSPDGALVILKEIPVEQMSRDERLAAQNECQVLKLLNHPNIIEYYENFLEDKALMIAMEYAPGGTLADYIQKRCNSLLDEDTILHFFVQILLALYHVHNKLILHRDLKTQNILLDKHQMIVKIDGFL
uniref:Protein kinase domain-containing protein n=1 Tax=Hippocampus comes TaxID=109280 RepID=A0A3Q2Z9P2_HIPCM